MNVLWRRGRLGSSEFHPLLQPGLIFVGIIDDQ
jgi:hypothetical protein